MRNLAGETSGMVLQNFSSPVKKTWKMIRTIRVGNSSRVHIDASNDAQLIFPLCSVHLLENAMKRLTQYLAVLGLVFYGSGLADGR